MPRLHRQQGGRARADAELAEDINRIHQESDGTYGVPRVTAELKDSGRRVHHKRVERVMRKFHIVVGLHLREKAGDPAEGREYSARATSW